jgi:hypothetical protein
MIREIMLFRLVFSFAALAVCASCSPPSTPVQEGILVGKWQRVDKPAIRMVFLGDGTFSAHMADQRLLGGRYRLLNGEQIVLDLDASSPKPGLVTNRVSMSGEELRIIPAEGHTERYRRVEE